MKRGWIVLWALFTFYLLAHLMIEGSRRTSAELFARQNQYLLNWIQGRHGIDEAQRLEKWSLNLAIDEMQYGRTK